MRKILLLVLLMLLVINCEGRKFVKNLDSVGEKNNTETKWEKIKNSILEEIKKNQNMQVFYPFGIYFWDEFASLQDNYGLDLNESNILGKWTAFDGDVLRAYTSYIFYPNRLLVIYFDNLGYFREEPNKYLRKAVGLWDISDGKIIATIYFLITEENLGAKHGAYKYEQSIIETVPYKMEIVDSNSIDPAGYSKRPFNYYELPIELMDIFILHDNIGKDWLMVRTVYWLNLIFEKETNYFKLVPEMAELDISGLDIMRDKELFRKYVLDFKPI